MESPFSFTKDTMQKIISLHVNCIYMDFDGQDYARPKCIKSAPTCVQDVFRIYF